MFSTISRPRSITLGLALLVVGAMALYTSTVWAPVTRLQQALAPAPAAPTQQADRARSPADAGAAPAGAERQSLSLAQALEAPRGR